jgi:PST family polysaccharide transporter
MNLLKTTFGSAISTGIRIITGILVTKVLAVAVGPSGIALLRQFSNYLSVLLTIGNGGINTGVTKFVSQYAGDKPQQTKVIQTAFSIALYSSIVAGICNLLFARELSVFLFRTEDYKGLFYVVSLTIIFSSLNSTTLAILNGLKRIRLFIFIGIINSLIGFAMTCYLALYHGIYGALLSVVLTQSLIFIVSILLFLRSESFSFSPVRNLFSSTEAKGLSQFTLMTMTTALMGPMSQIFIRNYISENLSIQQAGYWQGVVSISNVYLMLITTSLFTYYLPRLSEISNKTDLIHEVIKVYKFAFPITILMSIIIYAMRLFIIQILYTPKFYVMEELFLFQMIGDVLKISAWVLGCTMVARSMTKMCIISEVVFNILLVLLSFFFIDKYQLVGVTYAYAANYLMFFIFVAFAFFKLVIPSYGPNHPPVSPKEE